MKRQILYALIIIGVCLIALESIARVIETQLSGSGENMAGRRGWQTEFFGSLFDWHENDPDLLWRFKAGLDNPLIKTNSDHLLGPEISKTKDAHTFRLLLLGDSSPVGLGLTSRRQAFGEQVRYLLDKQIDASRRVELVNAAVSGYSSEQIVRLLKLHGEEYDPDLVILYCGNNDASISGAYPDE
ncbi:MAG: hypothetical protein GY841_05540, partial [FCB group bacterium]|nr:hypothetical protein [FCB group bacterium]